MFRKFLNPDNALMITMTQITDCIFLSLFWILGCFPVVTIGASTAALYDATFRAFRKGEKNSWQRFARVFVENWKAGIVPTVLFLAVFALAGWGMIQVWNAAATGVIAMGAFSVAMAIGVTVLGILSVLFPVLSRFENTAAGLLRNALLLALANLPRTFLLGALNAAAVWLCFRYIFPVFFLPSLAALVGSGFLEPMFRPYMNSEEDAAA